MNIFRLINEKVITVFICSMITLIAFSSFLTNVDKEDLQKAIASVNFNKKEETIEIQEIDLVSELSKEDNLNKMVSFSELTVEEAMQAISLGSMKLEYSALYTTSASRLTKSKGAIYFNGHKETYYSQKVLPGVGLNIPGRHVADDGTIRDAEGYISVAANPSFMSKGSVVITSLGPAKVYDTGCAHGVIDIYVNW